MMNINNNVVIASEIENMLRRSKALETYDYRCSDKYDNGELYDITDFIIDDIHKVDETTYRARMIFVWSDTASFGNEDNCERAGYHVLHDLGEQKIFKGKATIKGIDAGAEQCSYEDDTDGYILASYDISPITKGSEPNYDKGTFPIPYIIFEIKFDDNVEKVEPDDPAPISYGTNA